MSLKDPELGIPGNAGLKDQVMAMQWVKENCMYFGGDPENISEYISEIFTTSKTKTIFWKYGNLMTISLVAI